MDVDVWGGVHVQECRLPVKSIQRSVLALLELKSASVVSCHECWEPNAGPL